MIVNVADINRFFEAGIAQGATHMIIVTDELGHCLAPIYARTATEFLMQRARCDRDEPEGHADIYYLDKPKLAQIYRSEIVQKALQRWLIRREHHG